MIEIRRILCPIDFSDFSRRALDNAIAIARWYESSITVLHVYQPVPVAAYGPGPMVIEPIVLTSADRAQLLGDLKRFAEAEAAPGVAVDAVVREGGAASEIIEQADAMNADLIVMGTHGRSGFERLFVGSVTEKVLRKTSQPVLAVPRRHPDAVPAGPVVFKQILCPVDFSDSSMRALTYAASLAQESGGRLTIIHVVSGDFANAPALGVGAEGMSLAAYQRDLEDQARRRLEAAVPPGVGTYCTVESMLVHGKPWQEILRIGADRQADLIVMGVQGRGAADLMFFGSTTQHVVREASCPVLTIRK